MFVSGFTHMRAASVLPEQDGGSPRVGITGDCELSSVDAGNRTCVLWESSTCSHCGVFAPALGVIFFTEILSSLPDLVLPKSFRISSVSKLIYTLKF